MYAELDKLYEIFASNKANTISQQQVLNEKIIKHLKDVKDSGFNEGWQTGYNEGQKTKESIIISRLTSCN